MKTENEEPRYGGRLWPGGQGSLPPPPRGNGGRGSPPWKFIVGIGGAAVVVAVVTLLAMNPSSRRTVDAQDTASLSQSAASDEGAMPPLTTGSSDESQETPDAGTADPTVPDSTSDVLGTFNAAHGWSHGTDLRFGVLWIRYPWPKCYTHTFSTGGTPRGAFYSDCAWDDNDLALFLVNFKNRSANSITLSRLNLTLRTTDGRVLTPIDVGTLRKFFSSSHVLGWRSQWTAWVAFDNSGGEIHPISMSYQLGGETLTQLFEGSESVVGPR
jgi:hypothetical protein